MRTKVVTFEDIKAKKFSLCARDYLDDDSIVDARDRIKKERKEKTVDKE